MKKILLTGGCGFIGRVLVKKLINKGYLVINIDKITYASKKSKLVINNKNYVYFKKDIIEKTFIKTILKKYKPDYLINVAAESHVDNSITDSRKFIQTNIHGTANLLDCTREYLKEFPQKKKSFIFFQISTDEVYGDISKGYTSKESDNLKPSSPYSSSKAAADLLVTAWSRTYGINYLISRSSNNYGPYQYPEKFIPVILNSILKNKKIPVYGTGSQKREWIYVEDNVDAIVSILEKGKKNSIYNIGTGKHKSNLDLVKEICKIYDDINNNNNNSKKLIKFVKDRLGHDKRYALSIHKIKKELEWKPKIKFNQGLKKTIIWYLKNQNFLN